MVYDCLDATGQSVEPLGIPIEVNVRVDVSQGREQAESDAASTALHAAIATIGAEVGRAPNDPVFIMGGYSFPVLIRDFALEIEEPICRLHGGASGAW